MAAVEPQVDPSIAAQVLYERHSRRLLGYFVYQLGSRDEAEDALQTTFLHAVRGLRRGVVPAAEWPWLLTIARNVCLTRWEATRRRRNFETPRDPSMIEARAPAAVEASDLPLRQALAALPEQQRRAILMREWQGLSYREIADELGVSVGAVESLLFRARGSLTKQLRSRRALDLGSLVAGAKSLATGGAVAFKVAVIAGVTGLGAIAGTAALGPEGDGTAPKPASRLEAGWAPPHVARPTPLLAPTKRRPSIAGGPVESAPEIVPTPSSSLGEDAPTAPVPAPPADVTSPSPAPAPEAPTGASPVSEPPVVTEQPPEPTLPTSPPPQPSVEVPTVSPAPVTEVTEPVVEEVGGVVEDVVEKLPVAVPETPTIAVPETPTLPTIP